MAARTFVHATSESGDHYYFVFKEELDEPAARAAMIAQQKAEGWYDKDSELSVEHVEVSQ